MTSWMNRLKAELATASKIRESDALLNASIQVDLTSWQKLRELQSEAADHQVKLWVEDAAGDGHDLLQDDFNADAKRNYELVCVKDPIERALRYFFTSSLREEASKNPSIIETATKFLIADIDIDVLTAGLEVEAWNDRTDISVGRPLGKSPREFITDATGAAVVPQSVAAWLPDPHDTIHSTFFGANYSRRLALALPTSVLKASSGALLALSDLKRKTSSEIEPEGDEIWKDAELAANISRAARWIYSDGPDIENRHTILATEIARSLPKSSTWGGGLKVILDNALDTAKIAYRLHLYDKSIDALKLMSDLRKGLSDDVKSVSTQTTALSAGLWRDAAVAVGAVAIKTLSGGVGLLILTTVAVYLSISWYLNTRLATEAVASIEKNELVFRRKLYGPLLANDEYNDLAGDRYAEVLSDFRNYRWTVSFVYWLTIFIVCLVAVSPYAAEFKALGSCAEKHLTQYAGRAFMADAIPLFPFGCASWL